MKVTIRSHVVSADNLGLLRQLQETYGCRVAHLAAEHRPFLNIGELHISPICDHPLLGVRSKNRGSFDARTNTYFVTPPADYLRLASSDWSTRVGAYSDVIEAGIGSVAKTRLTSEERATLLSTARQARSEISASTPAQIVEMGLVYVRADPWTEPLFSFSPHPGLIPVAPKDIPDHQPVLPPRDERHFKLYAKGDDGLKYREAWFANDMSIVEHWGNCGDRGEARRYALQSNAAAREKYMRLKKTAWGEGFRPIPLNRHAKLLVEFRITGMGSQSDLDRRHALEKFLDELVGWLGLGHVDGGSIGSGTMEVLCYVVDWQIAKRSCEEALRGSQFSDFARIYREA